MRRTSTIHRARPEVRHAQNSAKPRKVADKKVQKVAALLAKMGSKLRSAVLSSLAVKVREDPFAKVKTLVQQLIERLVREKTDEATQKGWCDTELAKAKHDRDYRHSDTESLSANIAVLEARKASLLQRETDLTASIAALNTAHTEATTLRDTEKSDNKETLQNASDGLSALKNAIAILKDFYRKAGRASTSFVQVKESVSPVDQDMAAAGTGEHLGAYKGNQVKAGGILGMLATIQSDFERTISETTAAEEGAHRDYVKFDIETKSSIAAQEMGLKRTNEEHQTTSTDLAAALNDLKENQKLLDNSLKTLETLRPACIDTGMTWEEKVAKRNAEIEALKDALCVLDEEDQAIPECRNSLFLQAKK